jgi:CRISPR-associated exonuclease Cas4
MWWLVFFLLLAVGAALLLVSRRWRKDAGIPGGRIVSVDLERDGRPAPTMLDEALGLTGRPDLLLETPRGKLPVEIKSGLAPAVPHLSHVLQLAAYCRLTEATYGRRPHNGVLHYADRSYSLPYTQALERDLLLRVGRIRAQVGSLPDRSHRDAARCAGCGYASMCDQRLSGSPVGQGGWL